MGGESLTDPTEVAPRRRWPDAFEWCVLGALALLSLAVQADVLRRVIVQGGTMSGSDALLVSDEGQYFALVRSASQHVLAANLFQIPPSAASYLHPGLVISGALVALGLSAPLAYLAWKPVTVVAIFAGFLLYVRRLLSDRFQRAVALLLALFAFSPVIALVELTERKGGPYNFSYTYLGREMWPIDQLWGYLYSAVAIALMPLVLLAYERARAPGPDGTARRGRLALAGAAGLLCAWLRPWQGLTVLLIMVAAELFAGSQRRPAGRIAANLAPVGLAIALPILYYVLLSRYDSAWAMVQAKDMRITLSASVLAAGLLPLGIPALLAYRLPVIGWQERAVRWWPPVAVGVYLLPVSGSARHPMSGISLPLAILAVTGVASIPASVWPSWLPRLRRRWLAVTAVALFCTLGTVANLIDVNHSVFDPNQAAVLRSGEADALAALDQDPRPGGVLSTQYLGTIAPGSTGRATWVGMGLWTPDDVLRASLANALFDGGLSARGARRVVRNSRARFLLSDCLGRADLTRVLRPMLIRTRHFGCATLYEVRPGGAS